MYCNDEASLERRLDAVDPILVFEEETHERCACHVCNTLRNLLAANVEAEHDCRSPTPLLLTFKTGGRAPRRK